MGIQKLLDEMLKHERGLLAAAMNEAMEYRKQRDAAVAHAEKLEADLSQSRQLYVLRANASTKWETRCRKAEAALAVALKRAEDAEHRLAGELKGNPEVLS